MNTLETLPVEVFSHVMSFLNPKQILKTREVSRTIESKVREMKKEIRKRLGSKRIDFETFEDFRDFISKVSFAPFTNFRFGFDPLHHLDAFTMEAFMDRYGKRIWSLEIPTVCVFMSEAEIKFFNKMTGLRELEVEKISAASPDANLLAPMRTETMIQGLKNGNVQMGMPRFPTSFNNIQKFKFIKGSDGPTTLILLHNLPNLTSLFMGKIREGSVYYEPDSTMLYREDAELFFITDYLNIRTDTLSNGTHLNNLKLSEDFEMYSDDIEMSIIEEFVRAFNKSGVKLEIISDEFVSLVLECPTLQEEEKMAFCNLIQNMYVFSLHPPFTKICFDGLEKLKLTLASFEPSQLDEENFGIMPQNLFDKLKELSFCVESGVNISEYPNVVQTFWNYLFGREMNAVKKLSVNVRISPENGTILMNPLLVVENLKKLESLFLDLHYYPQGDYAILLHEIAKNMPELRYLALTFYGAITNDVFVGPYSRDPSICRMKKLRHLKICHKNKNAVKSPAGSTALDIMKDIFPRLSLTCLQISGDLRYGVFERTPERIRALLYGNIGHTLRYIKWDHRRGSTDEEGWRLLSEQISRNRAAIASITLADRCSHCEMFD